MAQSPQRGRYDKAIDRESAYELLLARNTDAAVTATTPDAVKATNAGGSFVEMGGDLLGGLVGQAMKSAVRQAANQIGCELVCGLLGSLLGGKRR